MADIKKRYDEQPVLSGAIVDSDISCIQRFPFGSGSPFQKYTQADLATYIQGKLSLTSTPNIIHVATSGNDLTANGTPQFPFNKIKSAQVYIRDNLSASSTNYYVILVQPGNYVEGFLKAEPFVFQGALFPNTVSVELSNDLQWSTEWLLQSPFGGFFNLDFSGAGYIKLTNGVSTGYNKNGKIDILNCKMPYFNLNFGRDVEVNIANCPIDYYETNRSVVDINNCKINTTFVQSGTTTVRNSSLYGTVTINNVLGSDDVFIYNSSVPAAVSISGSTAVLSVDATSYPNNLTVTSSAVVNKLTKSNSILTNYTPINFTPADDSLHGTIEGIDAALSGAVPITQGTELLTWSGVTASPYTSNVYWTKEADMICLRFEASAVVATTSGVITSSALPGGLRPFMATNFIAGNLIAMDNGSTVLAKINIDSSGVITLYASIDGASFSGLSGIGNTGYNSFVFSYTR